MSPVEALDGERPGGHRGPAVQLGLVKVGIKQAAPGADRAAERRLGPVDVRFVSGEIGAQHRQCSRENLRLVEYLGQSATEALKLGYEAVVRQLVHAGPAGRQVWRADR
jgi:hypothetical protein